MKLLYRVETCNKDIKRNHVEFGEIDSSVSFWTDFAKKDRRKGCEVECHFRLNTNKNCLEMFSYRARNAKEGYEKRFCLFG